MTTINKSKVIIINQGLTSIFIAICFLLSLIQSQEAYAEMKKVSGTSGLIVNVAETRITVAYSTVKGYLNVYNTVLSSADPDWNNARFFFIRYDESAKEWGKRGYGVITHPGGDQTFIKFEYREISATEGYKVTAEQKGFFIGGTGKFKGIKARWLCKRKFIMSKGVTAEWTVEYF